MGMDTEKSGRVVLHNVWDIIIWNNFCEASAWAGVCFAV